MKNAIKRLTVLFAVVILCVSGSYSTLSANEVTDYSIEEEKTEEKDLLSGITTVNESSVSIIDLETSKQRTDDQTITYPIHYPYSAIARIDFTYECGCKTRGTGYMFSDYTMATAGHFLLCNKHMKMQKHIECLFLYDNGCWTKPNSTHVSAIYYSNYFINSLKKGEYDCDYDFAFIDFSGEVGSVTGYLGTKVISDDHIFSDKFNICGCTNKDEKLLKRSKEKAEWLSADTFGINKKFQGISGGPVFDDDNYVVGINCGDGIVRRFTQDIVDELEEKGLLKSLDPFETKVGICKNNSSFNLVKGSRMFLAFPGGEYKNLNDIEWKSSDSKIASVSYLGVVYANSIGEAIITGEFNNTEVNVKVQVEYKDVNDPTKFWYEPTYYLSNKDVVKGYDNQTKFKPANKCTRAQMITFLWRLVGCPDPDSKKCVFSDVKKGVYFYKAVIWGNENGIVEGYKDGTFGPQKVCKRKHAVTFLWRLAGEPKPGTKKNKFTDITEKDYFYQAVLWASKNKIVAGYSDGTFKPNGDCLRRQMVTFLYKYDQYSQSVA